MIDIKKLTSKDVRRAVIYTNGVGEQEQGTITSWNDVYIFVDYGKHCGRGIATDPRDLHFLSGT